MFSKKFMKKERRLWHSHFVPSLIAAVMIGFIFFLFEATLENIILFASVGGSAAILTNSHAHHLTKLHTTMISYIISIIITFLLFLFNKILPLSLSINSAILIFTVAILMYLTDSFHPPALTAAISFFTLDAHPIDLIYLFLTILVFLTLVRALMYVFSQHLPIKEFINEFKRSF